ncbi:MAG TPA: pitrilysin family protein [Tepidisphaeraceae bacterium]|nr:pitrilysin family protein [Tepidisphaeraceae bacterium]
MDERIHIKRFDNGLVLLVEHMPDVRSAALTILTPAGGANDPADRIGTATVLAELTLRGAGNRSSRELSEHLDQLGLQRAMSVNVFHTRYSAAGVADKVLAGLSSYADILRRPNLEESEFVPARELSMQSLSALDDDPRSQAMIELRKQHWPDPLGRNPMGQLDTLEALNVDTVRSEHARRFVPEGTIISIAGFVDVKEVESRVTELFADWKGRAPVTRIGPTPKPTLINDEKPAEQMHITIAWPSVPESDPSYYAARLACELLGGASSSRLFTEVREKRGLCYSVGVSYASLKDRASLLGYAGTTVDRAQQTLDQFIHEVRRLAEGIEGGELHRARVGLKSATIMSAESTGARAAMNAGDYYIFGRARSISEVAKALDSVTLPQINEFVRAQKPSDFTIVNIGPRSLTLS